MNFKNKFSNIILQLNAKLNKFVEHKSNVFEKIVSMLTSHHFIPPHSSLSNIHIFSIELDREKRVKIRIKRKKV